MRSGQTLEKNDIWREDIFSSLEESETSVKFTVKDVHELFNSEIKEMEEKEANYKSTYNREQLKNHLLEQKAIMALRNGQGVKMLHDDHKRSLK